MNVFFEQVHEFCQMVQCEVAKRWNHMPVPDCPNEAVKDFMDRLLLCPTKESVQTCIERHFPAALGFAQLLDNVNRAISAGTFRLPTEWPKYQTVCYVLVCTTQEFLNSTPATTVPQPVSK